MNAEGQGRDVIPVVLQPVGNMSQDDDLREVVLSWRAFQPVGVVVVNPA